MVKAAIQGSFADYQNIKSRSVMVLKIEIPIEQAKEALDILGYPMPGQELPVALARIDVTVAEKPKSFAQQAKLMAKDEAYQRYLNDSHSDFSPIDEVMAEKIIEDLCGVLSCSELIEGSSAGKRFKQIQAQFLQWRDYGVNQ